MFRRRPDALQKVFMMNILVYGVPFQEQMLHIPLTFQRTKDPARAKLSGCQISKP